MRWGNLKSQHQHQTQDDLFLDSFGVCIFHRSVKLRDQGIMSYSKHPFAQPLNQRTPPLTSSSQYTSKIANRNGTPNTSFNSNFSSNVSVPRKNAFEPGHRPMNSMDLARQFEVDMRKIRHDLFQNRDIEEYISHVPIVEDSRSPSSRPPPNSPLSNKKERYLILSKKSSGRMMLHKAKVSSTNIFQIGRSWDFDELKSIELDDQIQTGLIFKLGKLYYWEVHTPKERRIWTRTVIEQYMRYNNGKIPELINCSIEYFHLEEVYESFQKDSNSKNKKPVHVFNGNTRMNNVPQLNMKQPSQPNNPMATDRTVQKSFTNPQRSPTKSDSPDITTFRQSLGSPSPITGPTFGSKSVTPAASAALNSTAAALTGGAIASSALASTGAALAGAANAKNIASSESDNKARLDAERKKYDEDKIKEEEEKKAEALKARRELALKKRAEDELQRRRQEYEEHAKKQKLLEEEEIRKKQLEEQRLANLKKQEEEEKRKQEEAELLRQQEQLELERQQLLKEQQKQKEAELLAQHVIPPQIAGIAKRGAPSAALSETPSQMSFEYGDETKFQTMNQSFESAVSSDLDSYTKGYASNGEEETAPLSLNLPKPRAKETIVEQSKPLNAPTITTTLESDDEINNYRNTLTNNNLLSSELDQLLTPKDHLNALEVESDGISGRPHARSRAFSRVSEIKDDDIDFLEIFEEIGYDPVNDDSSTIEAKILKELDKLQYSKIKTLTETTNVTSALRTTISNAFKSCDHIDPILSLFGIELSTFKDDVDFIEEQGQGLQVEATNEKLLMNELNEIVHSVEIPDLKLQKIISPDIKFGYQNSELEKTLYELYNALLKISDQNDDSKEENASTDNYQISKMKALQEKKHTFEGAKNKFITNLKKSSSKLFESVSLSLSSKLAQTNYANFDNEFLKTAFLEKSSYLLTISGLILFVKNTSVEDYQYILNSFINAFKPFFENLITFIMKDLSTEVSLLLSNSFAFLAEPATIIDEDYMKFRSSKDFGSNRVNLFTKDTSKPNSNSTFEDQKLLIKHVDKFFSQLTNIAAIEQELMKNLFVLSSSNEYTYQSLMKKSLQERCESFLQTTNFLAKDVESDREVADDIYELMRQIFDPVFGATLKIVSSISKNNMILTPGLLSLLNKYFKLLAPTAQEYLYGSFSKLDSKINSLWIKEVDVQIHDIFSNEIHCMVSNSTKAYPVFFFKIQGIIDSLDLVNVAEFGSDEKNYGNYYMMFGNLKAALNKGVENAKLEVSLNEHEVDNDEGDIKISIQKHLTLWVNYKWLHEEVKHLKEYPKDLSKSIDDLRDQELKLFGSFFAKQYHIGNIMRLVDDLENLISNGGNPSNYENYAAENIKTMMSPFKGDTFKQDITNIANDLNMILAGRCYNKTDPSKENEYTTTIGKQIEKELYNNCMYSLSQLYISTFTKLSAIVEKHYTNFEVPVDKYIINFNFKKHYL